MPSFKSLCLIAATSLLPVTVTALDEATHPFIAANSTASRSPCPALNSLANHGILPRDGKGIDLTILATALKTGFNLAADASNAVGTIALATSKTGNASTFDLADITQHSPQVIEHDGSMSRNDSFFGDAQTFNDAAWTRTLANWGDNETIDFALAGTELSTRLKFTMANTPQANVTFAVSGASLEYTLILSVFGDPSLGNGNKTLIKYMFENERLPLELGWQPPTDNITLATAKTMATTIASLVKLS